MELTTMLPGQRRSRSSLEQWRELFDRFEGGDQTWEQFCAERKRPVTTVLQ